MDPPLLQVWGNTKFGDPGRTTPATPCPPIRSWPGARIGGDLPAGVDVQGDRIEVQVVGWGRDEDARVINYRVLWGDPSGPRL
jgi:hypothetical protein